MPKGDAGPVSGTSETGVTTGLAVGVAPAGCEVAVAACEAGTVDPEDPVGLP